MNLQLSRIGVFQYRRGPRSGRVCSSRASRAEFKVVIGGEFERVAVLLRPMTKAVPQRAKLGRLGAFKSSRGCPGSSRGCCRHYQAEKPPQLL